MPARVSPQFRFLLRGSGLLLTMLALWWWVLRDPMLSGMRFTSDLVLRAAAGGSTNGSVVVASNGDWLVRVPISASLANEEPVQRAFGRAPGASPVKVRSFRLAIAVRIPTFFTLSFPLFWAVVLAGPWTRRWWRRLAIGTAILSVLAILSLLFYTAYSIQSNLGLVHRGLTLVFWNSLEYLNVNVVPYMMPLLLGLGLHSELRQQIFSFDPPPVPGEAAAKSSEGDKPRRGRYRG